MMGTLILHQAGGVFLNDPFLHQLGSVPVFVFLNQAGSVFYVNRNRRFELFDKMFIWRI